jgi:hypothetical protein
MFLDVGCWLQPISWSSSIFTILAAKGLLPVIMGIYVPMKMKE